MHLLALIGVIWTCLAATADGDSLAVAADTAQSMATADTSLVSADPVWAWTRWPSIDVAITLAPLDGPQDILEKQEIVADRIDALVDETARLDTLAGAWQARHVAMGAQLEVLEDLADLQLGGDLEFQQRLENVREDALQAAGCVAILLDARAALADEVALLRVLSEDYGHRAARLREEEEGSR